MKKNEFWLSRCAPDKVYLARAVVVGGVVEEVSISNSELWPEVGKKLPAGTPLYGSAAEALAGIDEDIVERRAAWAEEMRKSGEAPGVQAVVNGFTNSVINVESIVTYFDPPKEVAS